MTQAIGLYGTDGFGYDAVGNILTRSRASGGTTTSVSYSYNTATNQLSKAAQTGGSTLSYSYDAAGNLIARKLGKTTQLALSYNADGRPAGAASESYKYDGLGERVSIGMGGCVGICGGSVFSSFIFGRGGELLAENTGSGQPVRSYVYLNGLPLALVDGAGNIDYILADQVGQPQRMVDGSSTLVWDRVPDAFGATVAQPVGMSAANPLRFPGQQYDAATGLHYNHFRDYDPALGRYVQSDPIGLAGGINTYAYAGGNPLRFTDPCGEGPLGAAIGGIIGALLEGVPTEGIGAVEGALEGARLGSLAEDLYLAARRAAAARSAAKEAAPVARTVIGKLTDLTNVCPGEKTLLDRLPNLGNPRANWYQNSSVLRQEMSRGQPIRDATVDPITGEPINNTGFLRAERNLLETHGWTYDPTTTMWYPPAGP